MSMRTQENDTLVNNLLGKIDTMDEKSLQTALEKVGNNEEGVREFLKANYLKDIIIKEKKNIQSMICLHMGYLEVAFIFIYLVIYIKCYPQKDFLEQWIL